MQRQMLACLVALPVTHPLFAQITFDLDAALHADLRIFDLLVREAARPVDAMLPAGGHRVALDASALSEGASIYRLTVDGRSPVRTLTMVKE